MEIELTEAARAPEWGAFLPAALLLAATPGANQLLTLRNGLRHGPAPAISASVGRFRAFALMVAAVAAGLGAVLTASEVAFGIVKWCGVVYLLWLGGRTLFAAVRGMRGGGGPAPSRPAPSAPGAPGTTPSDPAPPRPASPDLAPPRPASPDPAPPRPASPDLAPPRTVSPDAARPRTVSPDAARPRTVSPDAARPRTAGPQHGLGTDAPSVPRADGRASPESSRLPASPRVVPPRTPWTLARQEFLVAASNPKALLLFTVFLPQSLAPEAAHVTVPLLALGGAYIAIEFCCARGYAALGGRLRASAWANAPRAPLKRSPGPRCWPSAAGWPRNTAGPWPAPPSPHPKADFASALPWAKVVVVASGCSAAWQRASFGTKRSWVQIPPPRQRKHQVRPGSERSEPGLICIVSLFWEPFGSQLGVIFGIRLPGWLPRKGIPPPPSAMYASRPE
ncbi:hypothetical protein GCM10009863_19110 [Streptomyces axinellae]|uniref:Uncharacterized protein n=1 Tax=Streptomyces axinellae TaxID=552788 RepID=A0ABP6C9C5_9ACTN